MLKKVIIIVLAFLLVIIGGLGFYSFNLNQKIVALTELQADTNSQIGGMQAGINILDRKLTAFNKETGSQLLEIGDEIITLNAKIEDLPSTIDARELYQKVSQGVVEIVTETGVGEGAAGSGFIFHSEWFVVTAYHVVKDANKVYVILPDGSVTTANIISYCPYSDISVLKLKQAVSAEPLTLGDSSALAIGEPVIAIGSPFELSGTITSGIVSQKDRFVDIEYNGGEHRAVPNLIQCDASVNFGNSGGPLINAQGEVIGLVIARVDPLEGDGVYYAVSSNKLKRVADAIIDYGYYGYPWLGVAVADLTPAEAQARQLDTINGTLVTALLEGPAASAGVTVDDIIVAIDEIPIRETADLTSYLGENKSPQEQATLTILRHGIRLDLSVELARRES